MLEDIKLIGGVAEAHALHGVYDFLVKIKADTIDEIKNITKLQIKKVNGVTSSLTLMIDDHKDGMRY